MAFRRISDLSSSLQPSGDGQIPISDGNKTYKVSLDTIKGQIESNLVGSFADASSIDSLNIKVQSNIDSIDSLNQFTSSADDRLVSLETFTGSLDDTFATDLEVTQLRNYFNSYTSSANNILQDHEVQRWLHDERLTSIETFTGSLLDTVNDINNIEGRLDSIEIESGSIRSDFNSFTSSFLIISQSFDQRISALETHEHPTATPVPTVEPNPTPVPNPTATIEPTATPVIDPTPTVEPNPTATIEPTATPVPDPTATPVPTVEPTATPVPDPTATPVPDPTATVEPTPTATIEPTPTPTVDFTILSYMMIWRRNTVSNGMMYDFKRLDSNGDYFYSNEQIKCIYETFGTGGGNFFNIAVSDNSEGLISVGDDSWNRVSTVDPTNIVGSFNQTTRSVWYDNTDRLGNGVQHYIVTFVSGEVTEIVSFDSIGDVTGCVPYVDPTPTPTATIEPTNTPSPTSTLSPTPTVEPNPTATPVPNPAPTYTLTNNGPVNEGQDLIFTLTTTNVPNGTEVTFTTGGDSTVNVDYTDNLPHKFVINNNTATWTVTTLIDNSFDGSTPEDLLVLLNATDSLGNDTGSPISNGQIYDMDPEPTPEPDPTSTPVPNPTATVEPTSTPVPDPTPTSTVSLQDISVITKINSDGGVDPWLSGNATYNDVLNHLCTYGATNWSSTTRQTTGDPNNPQTGDIFYAGGFPIDPAQNLLYRYFGDEDNGQTSAWRWIEVDNTGYITVSGFTCNDPTPTPTVEPNPTATPVPNPTSTPVPNPTATAEPTSTPVPDPTATVEPTSTPIPNPTSTPVPNPTATVEPTGTPAPNPTATPVPSPTYSLSSTSYKSEGGNITFTLTTTGLQNNDTVPFTLSGTATIGDDYSDVDPKEFVITNNSSTYTVTTFQDNTTDGGDETIILTLDTVDSQGNYTGGIGTTSFIGDSSLTPTQTPQPTSTQGPTPTSTVVPSTPTPTPTVSLTCLDSNNDNTVTWGEINFGQGNFYIFNGTYDTYHTNIGTYVLKNVSSIHPITVLNSGKENLIYVDGIHAGTKIGSDGNSYSYYYGDVIMIVQGNYGTVSYECYYHGYMGGQNNLVFSNTCDPSNPTPTPTSTVEPTATPVPPTPTSTIEPTPTVEPTSTPVPNPTATPVPDPTPTPTTMVQPTPTNVPDSTPQPTPTPQPTSTSQPNPTSQPTTTPIMPTPTPTAAANTIYVHTL